MEEQARRAALHAVAKIALGAGYLASGGCGGKVPSESLAAEGGTAPIGRAYATLDATSARPETTAEPIPFDARPNDSSVAVADTDVEGEAGEGLACLGSISLASPASLVDDEALACCETYVLAHPQPPVDGGGHDPSLVNCCTAAVLRASSSSMVRTACCFGDILGPPQQVWSSIFYCAPWGPPVPPALDWSAEEAA